jgi:4-amino-4-deoxy-L-arabinose transferase-like glycosyltransferase
MVNVATSQAWVEVKPSTDSPREVTGRWFLSCLLVLLLLSGTAYLSLSYGKPKFVRSEIAYAEQSREMLERHSWMQSYYHSIPCIDKPGMVFWAIIPSFKLLGMTPQAARMPSIMAALLSLTLLAFSMRPLFGARTALLATLILASSLRFIEFSASCMTDMILTLFDLSTLVCLYATTAGARRKTLWYLAAGVSAGCAVLTKGPVGLALPLASYLLYLALTKQLKHLLTWRVLLGLSACLATVAPWVVSIAAQDGGNSIWQWFWRWNVERFASPSFANRYPPQFMLESFCLGFAPWAVLVPFALASFIRDYGKDAQNQTRWQLLMWLFAGSTLLFFSVSKGKFNYYDLPCFPAAAAAVAVQARRWFDHRSKVGLAFGWLFSLSLIPVGTAACVLTPHVMGAGSLWYILPAIPFLGAAVSLLCMKNGRTERAFVSCASSILFSAMALSLLVMPAIMRQAPALSYLHRLQSDKRVYRLAIDKSFAQQIDWLDHALFFTGQLPEWTESSQQRSSFLSQKGLAFMIIPEDVYTTLPADVRAHTRVLERQPTITEKLTISFLLKKNGNLTGPVPLLLVSNH